MKRLLSSIVFALGAIAAPTPALCGDSTGVITEIMQLSDITDRLFVKVSGINSSLPSCSTQGNRYVFDTSTNAGRQLYAMLLAAKHAGATITLVGFGNCNLFGDSETMRGIIQN